jgi:hypothetical protein
MPHEFIQIIIEKGVDLLYVDTDRLEPQASRVLEAANA